MTRPYNTRSPRRAGPHAPPAGGPAMRTLRELYDRFPNLAEAGLSPGDVEESRRQSGANRLTPLPREPVWKKFLEKFDEPIIKILLAAALLSMVVDLFQASRSLGGAAVAIVVLAVLAFGRRPQWIPTILFASAVVLFFLGLF